MQNVVYLFNEFEGKENYVCWGIDTKKINDEKISSLRKALNEVLSDMAKSSESFVRERSFDISLGEGRSKYWVAVPRALSAKAIKMIGDTVQETAEAETVITSSNDIFEGNCPFEPVITYDRGFSFDSTSLNAKTAVLSVKEA